MLKWILIGVGALIVIGAVLQLLGLYRLSRTQPRTNDMELGLTDGRLNACPGTPNCISTQADPADATHYAEPIRYEGSRDAARRTVVDWIGKRTDAELVVEEKHYLHAVFTSRVFGFRDDAEFYFPDDENVVHMRSASRVGVGDMGVNRTRYREARNLIETTTEAK
jgi:uncharacterized protein (DUF1499 family)